MPNYTLRDIKTKKERDVFCSYTELQEILKNDPKLVQKLATPITVSGVGSVLSKTDDGWKDNLNRIKANSGRDNTIKV